eukprot:gene11276-19806_t
MDEKVDEKRSDPLRDPLRPDSPEKPRGGSPFKTSRASDPAGSRPGSSVMDRTPPRSPDKPPRSPSKTHRCAQEGPLSKQPSTLEEVFLPDLIQDNKNTPQDNKNTTTIYDRIGGDI